MGTKRQEYKSPRMVIAELDYEGMLLASTTQDPSVSVVVDNEETVLDGYSFVDTDVWGDDWEE